MNPLVFVHVVSVLVCAAGRHGHAEGAISPVLLVQPHGSSKVALVLLLLEIENFVELEMLIISIVSSRQANLLQCPRELLVSWALLLLPLTSGRIRRCFRLWCV